MDLTMSDEESRLLQRVLEHYLAELREEIGKTEKFDFRQELKREEEALKALLARIAPASR